MEITEVRRRLEELPDVIYDKEVDMVKAKSLNSYLNDMKKVVLSRLKQNYTGSNPERESQALASDDYEIHVKAMYEADRKAGQKTAEYNLAVNQYEAARSLKALLSNQ